MSAIRENLAGLAHTQAECWISRIGGQERDEVMSFAPCVVDGKHHIRGQLALQSQVIIFRIRRSILVIVRINTIDGFVLRPIDPVWLFRACAIRDRSNRKRLRILRSGLRTDKGLFQ